MPTKPQHKYVIGDRVAERPKLRGTFARTQQTKERIGQYRSQRYGTVVGLKTKRNRDGRTMNFLIVQWDHLTSPTEHAQMRICLIDQLQDLIAQIVVPGE